jgi:hypothetical protein
MDDDTSMVVMMMVVVPAMVIVLTRPIRAANPRPNARRMNLRRGHWLRARHGADHHQRGQTNYHGI